MTAPDGFNEIVKLYGNPELYRAQQAQLIWAHRILAPVAMPFPITYIGKPLDAICVHRKLILEFRAVLQAVVDAGLVDLIHTFDGVYRFGPKETDPDAFGIHTWAAAIDLNAAENPLGTAGTDAQRHLAECFTAHGWSWGGDFTGTKQPALFQFATGY